MRSCNNIQSNTFAREQRCSINLLTQRKTPVSGGVTWSAGSNGGTHSPPTTAPGGNTAPLATIQAYTDIHMKYVPRGRQNNEIYTYQAKYDLQLGYRSSQSLLRHTVTYNPTHTIDSEQRCPSAG